MFSVQRSSRVLTSFAQPGGGVVPAAGGSLAFDNASSAQGTSVANLSTPSWAIAGSNRLLIAALCWGDGAPPNFSALKWGGSGGTALTMIGSTLSIGSFHRIAFGYLIAPAAASQTLYGELSGASAEVCVGGVSFTGAHQSTPLGTEATNTGSGSGTNFTATVNVASATGEIVVDVAYAGSTDGTGTTLTIAVGAGQTMRWEQESIAGFSAGTQSTEDGAASVTMSHDFTFNNLNLYAWGIRGISVKPA